MNDFKRAEIIAYLANSNISDSKFREIKNILQEDYIKKYKFTSCEDCKHKEEVYALTCNECKHFYACMFESKENER